MAFNFMKCMLIVTAGKLDVDTNTYSPVEKTSLPIFVSSLCQVPCALTCLDMRGSTVNRNLLVGLCEVVRGYCRYSRCQVRHWAHCILQESGHEYTELETNPSPAEYITPVSLKFNASYIISY